MPKLEDLFVAAPASAKYEAWEARNGMSREVAMKACVRLVEHLQ